MSNYLPPDPERHEAEPESGWTAGDVFGGLCVLAVVLTACVVVASWLI